MKAEFGKITMTSHFIKDVKFTANRNMCLNDSFEISKLQHLRITLSNGDLQTNELRSNS